VPPFEHAPARRISEGWAMLLRADARENRARILDAASAVFAEHGPSAEVKQIASLAGVGVGTLYHHFPSKDDLLLAITRQVRDEGTATVQAAEAMPDALLGLQTLLMQAFDLMERYGWVLEALITGQLPMVSGAELQAESEETRSAGWFGPLVKRCVDAGQFRADLNVPLASAMLQGSVMPWAYRRFRGDRVPAESAALVLDTFLLGAAPR